MVCFVTQVFVLDKSKSIPIRIGGQGTGAARKRYGKQESRVREAGGSDPPLPLPLIKIVYTPYFKIGAILVFFCSLAN